GRRFALRRESQKLSRLLEIAPPVVPKPSPWYPSVFMHAFGRCILDGIENHIPRLIIRFQAKVRHVHPVQMDDCIMLESRYSHLVTSQSSSVCAPPMAEKPMTKRRSPAS